MLRDATFEDRQFLARLYGDTRRHEVSAWGWPLDRQEMFLNMQFEAQYRSYREVFPAATDSIVLVNDSPAGRLLVDRGQVAIHLIDIALLEEHRNSGIGERLLRRLLRECEVRSCALRLQVLQANRAIGLYRRLGFTQSSADAMYVQMEWLPL